MSTTIVPAVDAAADARWREWRARYAEEDRRREAVMRKVIVVLGTGLVIALATALMTR